MQNTEKQINNFTDLNAWKINHLLVLEIYKITKNFPREELFGVTNQLRRSAASITANVAEGWGRFQPNDRIHFYHQARGSLTETENFLILAKDLNYISLPDFHGLKNSIENGRKLINGLIRSTRSLSHNS